MEKRNLRSEPEAGTLVSEVAVNGQSGNVRYSMGKYGKLITMELVAIHVEHRAGAFRFPETPPLL